MKTLEVKRFFEEKVAQDAKLQQALDESTRLEEVVQVAGEQGFGFSVEELKQFLEGTSKGELDLDELGKVTGGYGIPPSDKSPADLLPGLRNVQLWLKR